MIERGLVDRVHECKSAKIQGLNYRKNMILVHNIDQHGDIIVGKIVKLFVHDQTSYFYIRQFLSNLDQHTRSYIMHEQNKFSLVSFSDLADCYPLSFYKFNGRKHFVVKHLVFNEQEYLL